MRTRWPRAGATLLVATVLVGAVFGHATADTSVHFDPGAVMVDTGESFEMSFRVAASPDSIASFQLYLWFDPTIVELTDAVEGTLYVESGTMTWFIAEEEYPGFWHFFDTVFGAGTHVLPPGELLHINFTALAAGQTPARIDTVRMTD
ncbi:cohesin domain-containing protein, partial [bacterium]|nr:cohesin domain-containing protein [bacterium]